MRSATAGASRTSTSTSTSKRSSPTGHVDGPTLERMRRLVRRARRPAARRAGHPHHRHQRQGLDGPDRDPRCSWPTACRVGTYTSPHLERINERIAVQRRAHQRRRRSPRRSRRRRPRAAGSASQPSLLRDPHRRRVPLVRRHRGRRRRGRGRAARPVGRHQRGRRQVAVVTNVGLRPHRVRRADSASTSRAEKAGHRQARRDVVLGETDPELVPIFHAEGPGERHRDAASDFDVRRRTARRRRPPARPAHAAARSYDELFLPLHGAHQGDNAAAALAAAEAFFGAPLDPETRRRRRSRTSRMPGRFEVVGRHPLVILDGAHNPDGADGAAAALDEEFATSAAPHPGRRHARAAATRRDARGARRARSAELVIA